MKKVWLGSGIAAIIALILYALAMNHRNGQPHVTIVVPADYCGPIEVFQANDPAPSVPFEAGDRFIVFNLAGAQGVLAKVPQSDRGMFTTFAAFNGDGKPGSQIYFRESGSSSWPYGMVNAYILSPTPDGACADPAQLPMEVTIPLQTEFERRMKE